MRNVFIFTIFLFLMLFNSSCIDKEEKTYTTWILLLDMSGVRESPEIRQQYKENFDRIAEQFQRGDAVVVAMITESSVNEAEFVVNHKFADPEATTTNVIQAPAEQEAFEKEFQAEKEKLQNHVSDFILNNPRITPNTDILSALHVAANVFKKQGNAIQNLIILSDMEQYDGEYSFPSENLSEERIAQIIHNEKQKARGIPDLNGVKVYVAGAKSKNSDRFFQIKNFWIAYFKATGATLLAENYGAALIEI